MIELTDTMNGVEDRQQHEASAHIKGIDGYIA
jgi:hypothetical protein